jgi:hypothetical protein
MDVALALQGERECQRILLIRATTADAAHTDRQLTARKDHNAPVRTAGPTRKLCVPGRDIARLALHRVPQIDDLAAMRSRDLGRRRERGLGCRDQAKIGGDQCGITRLQCLVGGIGEGSGNGRGRMQAVA